MTAATPAPLFALLPLLLVVCPQACGAVATVPLPVVGLPVYAALSSDLLQSFGAQKGIATSERATPDAAQPEAAASAPPTPGEAAGAEPGPAPELPDLGDTWCEGPERSRLRALLLRQKRAQYGYPPQGPDGSELVLPESIPAPDPDAAGLWPPAPDAQDRSAFSPRSRRSGPGWRYRHRGRSERGIVPEVGDGLERRGNGYLRRYHTPAERDLAPRRALPQGESMEYNGPWPWELEEDETKHAPDDTETLQLRRGPVVPGAQYASGRVTGPVDHVGYAMW